jgi:2-methylcitrate dehydratase PrpD
VNLEDWAARLLAIEPSPEAVALHVRDTVAAFLTGLDTADGRALCRFYAKAPQGEFASAAAAIARLSECDDIHLVSCVTPGAAVIPVALSLSGDSGEHRFQRAVAAGYSAGISLGKAIGGTEALRNGVWPSLLAAPMMSAVTASCLLGHDATALAHVIALSLAGASGRIGRPARAPSGRWFAFAESVLKGIRAAEAAGQGFRGDLELISPAWLADQAGHTAVDIGVFESVPPSISEVGFKPFPIARQGLNAVVAFQNLLAKGLDPQRIEGVQVFVPSPNVALLSRPANDQDRLSRISNIGYQLACAAFAPDVLHDPDRIPPPGVRLVEFARRVTVTPAQDLDAHLPDRWAASVVVTSGSERFEETVLQSPFDGDAPAVKATLTKKWRRIAQATNAEALFAVQETPPYAILWGELERRLKRTEG